MNWFEASIDLGYTTDGDFPESFTASGTVAGLREFCNWLNDCLRDMADMSL